MPDAVYAIPNFLGGEISQAAQGRFDRPDYRTSLRVCLNAFPIEIGPWTKRPGTQNAGTTRRGAAGRVLKFDFEQSSAVTVELTDGWMRFRAGARMLRTNDAKAVDAISTATPAVVETTIPHEWTSEDTVIFSFLVSPGETGMAVLQNRQFVMTNVDATRFSIRDAITDAPVDGSALGILAEAAIVERLQEMTTVYTGDSWSGVRTVQAETTAFLQTPSVAPQALVASKGTGIDPAFEIGPVIFNDGPYLDPFTNGVQAQPGSKSGLVDLALSFPTYDAAKSYRAGAFVTSAGVNYLSLVDQNVGNTPATSLTAWQETGAGAAINGGRGFLGGDIGRLVRLFSEPAAWLVGSTYAAVAVVSYNPSGEPGAATYWQSLTAGNIGHAPGSDLTNWQIIPQGAAIWTWGKIVSLSNIIDRALAGSASIGTLTAAGGLAAAFDGVFSQPASASAAASTSGGAVGVGGHVALSGYVGKNYSAAAAQKIQQVTIYPSNDSGLVFGNYTVSGPPSGGANVPFAPTFIINLRGKATLPASASDGTLLGTTGTITNTFSAITILAADQVTAWNYVWVEILADGQVGGLGAETYSLTIAVGELSLFNSPGSGTSTGVKVEILGPALLYTTPVLTWRLGVYSDTTGWPTCGAYDDGRLYLGGVVKNRFDACMSNGVDGNTVNFAPTNQYGAVAANSAISYILNARDANQIVWMLPEEGGLVMGTQAGEWLVRAPTTGPIAANNISARRITKVGAANIEPVRTEHTNIFVHRFRRKLTEYFPDAYSGKFTGPNLADKAEHIVATGIAELAYTSAVTPVLWGRCDDGSLFGVTYKRDTLTTAQGPTFAGWHRHTLGSGRTVESICGGPSVGGDLDSLTMVTNDPATGIRHVEVLTDTMGETAALADAWLLDDAVSAASIVPGDDSAAINGLWHLNGKTVQVFAGGLDCGDPGEGNPIADFVVANGSITVPYGDGISAGPGGGLFTADFVASLDPEKIVIGFTYNSDGQMVRPIAPADTGARNGPALGKIRRNHKFAMLLVNSLGLEIGGDFSDLLPVQLDQVNGDPIPPLTMYSGVVQGTLSDDYSYDGMVCWRASRPLPVMIAAFSGFIQTTDS